MAKKIFGLLGRKLGHSWSVPIHTALGCEGYQLIEHEPEDLPAFLSRADLGGINVTIPYKRDVMPYCDWIDEAALAIGSVNTLVRRPDGTLCAWNTDAAGFCWMAQRAGIRFAGKRDGASAFFFDGLEAKNFRIRDVVYTGVFSQVYRPQSGEDVVFENITEQ